MKTLPILENKTDVVAFLSDASPRVVTAALLAVYKGQTNGERVVGRTIYRNGVGFDGYDGKRNSRAMYMVRWCVGNGTVDRPQRNLSGRFVSQARRLLAKYWRQLVRANQAKREAVQARLACERSQVAVASLLTLGG
jgi:hypothetical protein